MFSFRNLGFTLLLVFLISFGVSGAIVYTAYQIIQSGGTPVTSRGTVNFIGPGVTLADNSGSNRTDVTVASISSPGQAILPGAVNISVLQTGVAAGDVDLYTCAAASRCQIGGFSLYNSTVSSVTSFLEIKVSGSYYRVTRDVVVGAGQAQNPAVAIILEAGESIAVSSSAAGGLNLTGTITQFSNKAPWLTGKVLGPFTGDNTVYTVPVSKTALLVSALGSSAFQYGGISSFTADAGGTRHVIWHIVPAAGSPGVSNQFTPSLIALAGTVIPAGVPTTLTAGQFISVNVDTGNAAQIAWVNVVEY